MNSDSVRNGVFHAAIMASTTTCAADLGTGAFALLIADWLRCDSARTAVAFEGNRASAASALRMLEQYGFSRERVRVIEQFLAPTADEDARGLLCTALRGVGAVLHEVLGYLAGAEGVVRTVLAVQEAWPKGAPPPAYLPAFAASFCVCGFVTRADLDQHARPPGGQLEAYWAGDRYLLVKHLPFDHVVAATATAAGGGGGAAASCPSSPSSSA